MKLSGLHFLLTYRCSFECDHCFVWGSPWQPGVMTLDNIRLMLSQARQAGLQSVSFEGGEPFLYYATLRKGVELAGRLGFKVGIVSNSYWATSVEDAVEFLRPLAPWLNTLTISSDLFHYRELLSQQAQNANAAAKKLGIPIGTISIARPQDTAAATTVGQLPEGLGGVMYRGRATDKLARYASHQPWDSFTACPHENLREPGRVHVDAYGNLHICQGLVIGNLFETPLSEICSTYNPEAHPIIGPLLHGGPIELVRSYHLPHGEAYADACHLCYISRQSLREQFPKWLGPDQMYGVIS